MHYSSFRIQNFKGIKDTTIKLSDQTKMGVFAFVGLNESGKTTILEAIHSFSPDKVTNELVGSDDKTAVGVPIKNRVPRHLISNFSGDVSVTAYVKIYETDRDLIKKKLQSKGIIINLETFSDELVFERKQRFKNGDFVSNFFTLQNDIQIKTGKQRSFRLPTSDEKVIIRDEIYSLTPEIAYFPTFVFDFPKRIFLTPERGGKISNFYRQVFQDILDYDGQGHTIEASIIRRIRSEDKITPWVDFFRIFSSSDDRAKIQHVMDRASRAVTEVVFGRWNKIFGEDAKGKKINISYETTEGEVSDKSGSVTKTNNHDIHIKFEIQDNTRRFDVNDRSLGFRWFFAFMLFTQFRVARASTRPILFLFDEPASNLHAAAQQRLIESFPAIAQDNHTLIYTTHSHYMIEPKWLEQTFIVTNQADAPKASVLDTLSLDDESLDIRANRYREFVNQHPSQTSYFQPILDRLEVVPSRFDTKHSSIVVEGKSDYYVLRYATKFLKKKELSIIPALGAGTFGALVALNIGWNLNMIFVLDGDEKGKIEKDRYITEYGLPQSRAITIDDLISGVKVIEDLLDDEALNIISSSLELSKRPTKNQIRRYFQECLARDTILPLGDKFKKDTTTTLDKLAKLL